MCIAIVKPAGTVISEEVLKQCFENNPDGAGFAYRTSAGMVIRKGLFTWDDFIAAYRECDVASVDALIHFRITTKGDDQAENTHPFELQHGALIHNGTIFHLGEAKGRGKSDTRVLAEHWYNVTLDEMQRAFLTFEHYVNGTRVAVMGHDGTVLVFNREQWIEKDGVLYSNRGFEMDVYGWRAHRNGWTQKQPPQKSPTRPAALLDATDVPDDDDLDEIDFERAEWWLQGAADGEWMWIDYHLFSVVDDVVAHEQEAEREVLHEYRERYGVEPKFEPRFGTASDELDTLTEEYFDSGCKFVAEIAATAA